VWITSSPTTAKAPTVIALGNFDGVHCGHRQVIQPILPTSAPLAAAQLDGVDPSALNLAGLEIFQGYSDRCFSLDPAAEQPPDQAADLVKAAPPTATVLTFFPHPQEYFLGVSRPLLTPIDEKAQQLKEMGVEQLVLLPFNQALAQLSPEEFVEIILVRHLQAQHISVGLDFRFGRDRAGTTDTLKHLAARWGINITVVPLQQAGGDRISSSRIRAALGQADLATAAQLLGRPYSLTGKVVKGQQLGRTLGFPTANLKLPADKFLPCSGVYRVGVVGVAGQLQPTAGVMNIGTRPTVDGTMQTIEVHLLGWSGDLYGQRLKVTLEAFLRPEQRFDSLDALKRQIQADCEAARA
jgi:riboflavin kinase / FMN adenylyltransferase